MGSLLFVKCVLSVHLQVYQNKDYHVWSSLSVHDLFV